MADERCVALKSEVKDVFDKALKPAVLKLIKQTIKALVDKTKGLSFEDSCKDGWILTATVLSVDVDNADKPTKIEAKVVIGGVPLFGTASGFKATGKSKAAGINAKKMEEEAKLIVDDALTDAMTKQALPQMLKS